MGRSFVEISLHSLILVEVSHQVNLHHGLTTILYLGLVREGFKIRIYILGIDKL